MERQPSMRSKLTGIDLLRHLYFCLLYNAGRMWNTRNEHWARTRSTFMLGAIKDKFIDDFVKLFNY